MRRVVPVVAVLLLSAPLLADPLFDAVKKGHVEAVRAALDGGADVNARDEWNRTLLLNAVYSQQLEVAGLLIERGADISLGRTPGRTVLHEVASNPKCAPLIPLLVKAGADPNAPDDRGITPLMYSMAIHTSPMPCREALLEAGADVGVRGKDGDTALHAAAAGGPAEAVRFLLDHGADVRAVNDLGQTPLHLVNHGGPADKVSMLLEAGADLHARDKQGATPLHAAVSGVFPAEDAAKALLDAGADANAKDNAGRTPLDHHMAAEHGMHQSILELLAEHSASGSTLHSATMAGDAAKVTELLKAGADPNARDAQGRAPLHMLSYAKHGQKEVATALIEGGADVNLRADPYAGTPLHANAGSVEVVKLLLAHDADPNGRNESGQTPLHAAAAGPMEVVEALIAAGADVNAQDKEGSTPLEGTCCCQELEVVRVLLAHGADPNRGAALAKAAGNGETEIARELLSHGADPNHGAPIIAAAEAGYPELVRLLLDHRADPLVKGGWRASTLLHAAAEADDVELVKLALEAGVPVSATDADGRTALQRAMRSGGFESDVWKALVEAGADVLATDKEGLTAIDWAAIIGAADPFAKIPADLRAKAARRSLHAAAIHNDVEAAKAFLDQGVSPNEKHFRDGKMPLHWATMLGNEEVAALLVERGADVNAREDNGMTPLHRACIRRGKIPNFSPTMVELLVSHGADVKARDGKGLTPIEWAVKGNELTRDLRRLLGGE